MTTSSTCTEGKLARATRLDWISSSRRLKSCRRPLKTSAPARGPRVAPRIWPPEPGAGGADRAAGDGAGTRLVVPGSAESPCSRGPRWVEGVLIDGSAVHGHDQA